VLNTLQVGSNEATESSLANVGVHTRGVGGSAAITPRNGTEEDLGGLVDDRTAGVTLARVLSTLGETGAEHLGGNSRGAVRRLAGAARDDRNINLEEVDGERLAAGRGSTPASNGEGGSSSRVGSGRGERSVRDGGAGRDGGGQLHDGDITVVGARDVARVDLDGGNTGNNTAGGTAVGTSADREAGGSLANSAVSSCEDGVGVQKGATAEVGAGALEGDDEGEFTRASGCSTDNVLLAAVVPVGDLSRILRDGCGEHHRWDGEDGEEIFDLHLEGGWPESWCGTEAGSERLLVL